MTNIATNLSPEGRSNGAGEDASIIRAAREAAADYGRATFAISPREAARVRVGEWDDLARVQWFVGFLATLTAPPISEERLREAPWGQCKVAFFDDGQPDCDVERVWDEFGPGKKGKLPDGWELCEGGISGAAGFYVLFDVEGVPNPHDGATVRNALADLGFMSPAALSNEGAGK